MCFFECFLSHGLSARQRCCPALQNTGQAPVPLALESSGRTHRCPPQVLRWLQGTSFRQQKKGTGGSQRSLLLCLLGDWPAPQMPTHLSFSAHYSLGGAWLTGLLCCLCASPVSWQLYSQTPEVPDHGLRRPCSRVLTAPWGTAFASLGSQRHLSCLEAEAQMGLQASDLKDLPHGWWKKGCSRGFSIGGLREPQHFPQTLLSGRLRAADFLPHVHSVLAARAKPPSCV